MGRYRPLRLAVFMLSLSMTACTGHSTAPAPQNAPGALQSVDSRRMVLYVAGLNPLVNFYTASLRAHDPLPLGSITHDITRASGLWVDKNGTLYVIDTGYPAKVLEYRRGATKPFRTITNGLYAPIEPAVDASGTLYVDDYQNGAVVLVYPPGKLSPSRSIAFPHTGRLAPGKMAFDQKGDIIVASFDVEHQIGTVFSISPGASMAVDMGLDNPPGGVAGTDAKGNIYVGSEAGGINVYAPGSKQVARSIDAGATGFYSSFSVTGDGTIYWPNYDDGSMYEFAPGASGPSNIFPNAGGVDAAVGPR